MTRRQFTGVLFLTLVGFFVGLGVFISKGFDRTVETFIKEDLKHLRLSQQTIDKYIFDGKNMNIWKKYSFAKIQFIRSHYFFSNRFFKLPYFGKYTQYRSEIVGNFLLSTDFFVNGMDESKPIKYLAIYNPYFTTCANPFSNLYHN